MFCCRAPVGTEALLADIGLSDHLSQTGYLSLYVNDAEFEDGHACQGRASCHVSKEASQDRRAHQWLDQDVQVQQAQQETRN